MAHPPSTSKLPPLWPIAVSREIHTRLDAHPGMTIILWLLSVLGMFLFFMLASMYEWGLWLRSWQLIWPDMPTAIAALPLVLLMIFSLLGRIWHGRIWAGLIIATYMLLQIRLVQLSMPLPEGAIAESQATTPALSQIGPLITAQPIIAIVALLHAILPVFIGWIVAVLSISLFWPSVQAGMLIVHTGLRARDETRRLAAEREAEQLEWQREHAHTQRMRELRFETWRDEEEHQALLNMVDRDHQRRELKDYKKNLLGAPESAPVLVQTAPTEPAAQPANQ